MSKVGDITFPDEVESRSFFSDIGLPDEEYLTTHNEYMLASDYQGASEYAEGTGHEYYGAYLFNALEGRIRAIGEYELAWDTDSIRPVYDDTEPTEDLYDNLTWISSTTL